MNIGQTFVPCEIGLRWRNKGNCRRAKYKGVDVTENLAISKENPHCILHFRVICDIILWYSIILKFRFERNFDI